MEAVKIRHALEIVMLISARGNQYLQRCNLGNALLAERPQVCAQVLSKAVNLIYALSVIIHPFMPAIERDMLSQLNAPARTVPSVLSNDILGGHHLGKPGYLFTKIDEKKADEWRIKFGGEQIKEAAAAKDTKKKGKKGSATAAAKVEDGPVNEEILSIKAQVDKQADLVRDLKGKSKAAPADQKPKPEDIDIAVAELLRLKSSLLEAQEKEKAKSKPN